MRRGLRSVRSASRALPAVAVVAALILAVGCGNITEPDEDAEMLASKGLLAGSQVTDSIDPEHGDKRDWREITHYERARLHVVYHIGDPFEGHDVRGVLEAYDASGNKLQARTVVPGQRDYELTFEVDPNRKYFLVFNAVQGASHYLIDTKAEPIDPCAVCRADEICEDGRCLPKPPPGCDPACADDEECQDGECVAVGCPRGEYLVRGHCRPDPCYRACKRSQRCVRLRRGRHRCEDRRPRPPVAKKDDCDGGCGAGKVCKGGKCVTKEGPRPALKASILNYWPEKGATVMLIDRGSAHGLKKGMTGYVKGGSVRIIEVYPYQSRATTKLTGEQPAGRKTVTFKFK